jgi:hypothetical protein
MSFVRAKKALKVRARNAVMVSNHRRREELKVMRHVFLPVEHTSSDIALAGQVAELLESGSLYVTWSPRGYESPQVQAAVRVVEPGTDLVLARAQGPGFLAEVIGCMAALVAGLFMIRAERAATRGVAPA